MKHFKLFNFTRVLSLLAVLAVVFAACEKDSDPAVRPMVTATNPVNKATNIAINSTISSTFNVAMDPSSITNSTFTLKQGTTNVAGTASYSGMTASFTPAADLSPNTLYNATITTGVMNTAGTSTAKNFEWTFTTGAIADIILPTVTISSPADDETGIALNQAITVTFSEPVDHTTLTDVTFKLRQGTKIIEGEITYSGNVATFTPDEDLSPNTAYTLTVTDGVKDISGNPMANTHSISFTTGAAADAQLPMVNATDPMNNATNVARNKVISVVFSEKMDASTINATNLVVAAGGNAVTGTVRYSGTTATFTPSMELGASTTYVATIKTGAKDLAGNGLAANISWEFTTGETSATLAPVNLGTSGNYVILAQSAINNSATSAVTGDVAISPAATTYITGFALIDATGYATSTQVTGKVYAADMADPTPINLTTAVADMVTGYNDAAGRPSPDFSELGTGNIGGKTLTPGLYKWTSTVTMPSDVTISGGENDVWIFQISGDLLMSSAVNITLEGGAQPKNIFWQVAGQATFGTDTHFEGIILSKNGITLQTRASMNGRALAQKAVILDTNAVTKP